MDGLGWVERGLGGDVVYISILVLEHLLDLGRCLGEYEKTWFIHLVATQIIHPFYII